LKQAHLALGATDQPVLGADPDPSITRRQQRLDSVDRRRDPLELVPNAQEKIFLARAHPKPAGSIRERAKSEPLARPAGHRQIGEIAILPALQTIAQRPNPEGAVGFFANRPRRFR